MHGYPSMLYRVLFWSGRFMFRAAGDREAEVSDICAATAAAVDRAPGHCGGRPCPVRWDSVQQLQGTLSRILKSAESRSEPQLQGRPRLIQKRKHLNLLGRRVVFCVEADGDAGDVATLHFNGSDISGAWRSRSSRSRRSSRSTHSGSTARWRSRPTGAAVVAGAWRLQRTYHHSCEHLVQN